MSDAELLAETAHQLRNHLQLLALRLDRLGRHVRDPGEQVYAAAVADVQNLRETVEALLGDPAPAVVDAAAVVRERIRGFGDAAAGRMRVGPLVAAPVRIAPGRLEQIVDVLVDNAIRHADPAVFTVSVHAEGRSAAVEVADLGAGLSEAERGLAPGRGWRGSGSPAGGTGLGLTLAARLLAEAGGRLDLAAGARGAGLRAVARLPLTDPPG
ncbi:sensor histidine kinase [Actinoplanes sp. RD1]|uniref:sensor histidine kinase n=1 Tax=Actinoplanes sp. RD1 TaxID=3064538 RepID=UPI0027418A77|nr:HAMP domain-containing sensor histidine kinase [Actinoplanes sp. RD1]